METLTGKLEQEVSLGNAPVFFPVLVACQKYLDQLVEGDLIYLAVAKILAATKMDSRVV